MREKGQFQRLWVWSFLFLRVLNELVNLPERLFGQRPMERLTADDRSDTTCRDPKLNLLKLLNFKKYDL